MSKTVRDLYNNEDIINTILPAVRTADFQGNGVDLLNFDGNMINFNVGAPGITLDANNRIELQIQESDDNTTFTAVADADMLGGTTGGVATGTVAILTANAQASQSIQAQYRGVRRYIRGAIKYIGTHGTGTAISGTVARGYPHFRSVR